jgi:hypothetical protein
MSRTSIIQADIFTKIIKFNCFQYDAHNKVGLRSLNKRNNS